MIIFYYYGVLGDFFSMILFVSFFLFFSLLFRSRNYIQILVYLEFILLSVNLNFIFFSVLLDDILGQIFSIFILAIAASESAIALAVLVLYYRIHGTISIYSLKQP